MRIGIDARELSGRPTGVGRYLHGLIEQWAGAADARRHDFVLYAHGPLGVSLDARRFPSRLVKGSGGAFWEQIALPRVAAKDHLDVFFAPAYTAPPLRHIPIVVAIHDLSFVAHPEWFSTREGIRRRWLTRRAAKRAATVITISDFSRRELIERLGVPDARIRVIPPGITEPGGHEAAAAPGRAPASTSVLFVGSIFHRRHLPDLIRAFAPIARERPDVSLNIVGDNRTFPREDLHRAIEIEGLAGRANWHEYVSEADLAGLYSSARAFAFLSEYEGLGLTPLEALSRGIPPVLLDTAVARESCGDAAVYVQAENISAITDALRLALFDEDTRHRVFAAAPGIIAKYDWPRAARDTLAAIESA